MKSTTHRMVLFSAWLCVAGFWTKAGGAQPSSFTYNDFSNPARLQFNGSANRAATGDGQVLELTPGSASQAGSAFVANPVTLAANAGFSTFFSFRLSKPGGSSPDGGITFTVQSVGSNSVGSAGSGLG